MTKHVKNPLQRLIAMLLCVVMVVGVLPMTALAEEVPAETEEAPEFGLAVGEDILSVSDAFAGLLLAEEATEPAFDASAREDDLETFTTNAIKFNLFNYNDHVNKVIVGTNEDGTTKYAWNPIVQYFTFRGGSQHANVDPNAGGDEDPNAVNRITPKPANMPAAGATTADGTPILGLSTTSGYNPTVDTDGFTATHATLLNQLDGNGNPTLDLAKDALDNDRNRDFNGNAEGTGDLFAGQNSYSLGYLFDPNTSHHGVTAYQAKNTPLIAVEGDSFHYYYNSKDNAVDYDIENSLFRVRNYVERTSSTAAYPGFSDFLPFTYTGGVLKDGTNYHVDQYDNDYWFGVTMEVNFFMTKDGMITEDGEQIPMEFFFSGDDDVWVFVDDVLVLDLGGTHGTVDGSINFATGEVLQYLSWSGANATDTAKEDGSSTSFPTTLKARFTEAGKEGDVAWDESNTTFADYTEHTLKFFYLERGSAVANCKLDFRLPTLPDNSLTVTKKLTTMTNGVEDITAAGLAIKDSLTYKFRVVEADAEGNATDTLFIKPGTQYVTMKNGLEVKDASGNPVYGYVDEDGFFYLKADEGAQFLDMLKQNGGKTDYIVQEFIPDNVIGQYDGVKYETGSDVGNIEINKETTEFTSYSTDVLSAENSPIVTYRNIVNTEHLSTLKITKKAETGHNIDSSKAFNVQVKLGGVLLPVGSKYTVDSTEHTVTTAGNIPLKVGQTAVIDGLISGTQFEVTEILTAAEKFEATYAGQVTEKSETITDDVTLDVTAGGVSGTLPLDSVVDVTVTNKTVAFGVDIPLSKTALGNTKETSFIFNAEQVEKNDNVWETVTGGYAASSTIEVTNSSATSGAIRINYAANTAHGDYYYRVYETPGTGPYIYDQNFYIVKVTVAHDAAGNTVATVVEVLKNGTEAVADKVSAFVNQKTTKVNISKEVKGVSTEGEFQFTATWNDQSESFSLKNGENKTIVVPVGAEVAVTEDGVFGYVTVHQVGNTGNYVEGASATVTAAEDATIVVKFTNFKYIADDTVVIDYGLPVEVNVLNNDQFPDGTDTDVTLKDATGGKVSGAYGFATVTGDNKIRYQFNDKNMTMAKEEVFTYQVTCDVVDNIEATFEGTLTIIPATTIYYEDSFLTLTSYTKTGNEYVKDETPQWVDVVENTDPNNTTQEEDRPGVDPKDIYGEDDAYTEMQTWSLGNAKKFTVTQDTRGEATFSFYGTGFDVISMTSNATGTLLIRYTGKNADGSSYFKNLVVDTYYGMKEDGTLSPNDPNALYQVPVMKVEGLEYGLHEVTIIAAYNDSFNHTGTSGQYDLYLDAIRIYDPANDGNASEAIKDAYVKDGEGWPEYHELRNLIIEVGKFVVSEDNVEEDVTVEGGTQVGVVFIDSDDSTSSIDDYKNDGPNNELYLAPGQAISFQLNLSTAENIADVQIGMKLGNGKQAEYKVYNAVAPGLKKTIKNGLLKTATDMYYSIHDLKDEVIVIHNCGNEGILSITNIKITYKEDPNGTSTTLYIDDDGVNLALLSLRTLDPDDEVPEELIPEKNDPKDELSNAVSALFKGLKKFVSKWLTLLEVMTHEENIQ